MSAPSSDGRPSADSEPSAASSHTFVGRSSGAYTDNGESSSSPRQSMRSRPATGTSNGTGRAQPGSPLAAEAIQEKDFARRKQRVRRSGGFLLDSAFPNSSGARHGHGDAHGGEAKGKRSSRHSETPQRHARQEARSEQSSSPLSRALPQEGQRGLLGATRVKAAGSQAQTNGQLRVDKTRKSLHVPQSTSHDREPSPSSAPQRQMIDPNQLVHMALNLSESRRRHVSTAQLLAPQSRATSGAQRDGSFSNYSAGGSLRQYLNEQRRASRNMSPAGGHRSPSRNMSSSMQRSGSLAYTMAQSMNHSPATAARVAKAQTYIQLRIEYLRLLEFLPPLKPDANAPGNFVISSNNVPGSPHAQLTRMPSYAGKQHELGRSYNPLQYIRNRRTRARERRTLDHSPEEFLDVDLVRDWVDRVGDHSIRRAYRRDDQVQLPKLHADHEMEGGPSKPARPHKGWVFNPEELLADAHWLEQGDNKTLIENRHGRKIFPPREIQTQDYLQPRPSRDYEKRRRSWVDALPSISVDHTTGDESEKGSQRGRKRRLLPTLRTESPRGGKHSRRGSRLRAKDETDSSGSDVDSGKRLSRIAMDVDHNIGPLALLLEQQTKEAHAKSPTIISPDTPDKWGRNDLDLLDERSVRGSLEVPRFENGFVFGKDHGKYKMPTKTRTNPALSIDDTEPRSSFEDLDTAPTTPLHSKNFFHIGSDLSPPPSRAGSETRKSKRSKLNIFHSHEHSGEYKQEQRPDSAGTDQKRGSRQPSEETQGEKHIGSSILAAPAAVRSLLSHRKNESVSSLPSPEKLRRRETQEPASAVSRFLKGVKHEGTKVGEFIFRKDRLDDSDEETFSDRNSVELDTDTSAKARRTKRPGLSRTVTGGTDISHTPRKNRQSVVELPTFHSVNEHHLDNEFGSNLEHHISRQTRERKMDRSPRFDQLAPPRMDLGTVSSNSSIRSLSPSRSQNQDRIGKVLARPGADTMVGLPPTALRYPHAPINRHRSTSRPNLDGKRHWSIADDDEHILHRKSNPNVVTQADIARVRALFLCSGVKAKEISRRAHATRVPAPDFLSRVATTAKIQLSTVPRKEEHVLAARILVKDLESSTDSLQRCLANFRNNAIRELSLHISGLQSSVDSDLMPRILNGGDDAISITTELSGQGPLQVKQIIDEIDRMRRARRRRMRWIRGFGWMLVEWALLALMWLVWLVVILVGSVKKVFGLGWGVARWLLWF